MEGDMNMKRPVWFPVSQKPECHHLAPVIFKGGNYMLADGLFCKGDETLKEGFYIVGGGNLHLCKYVEWWFPLPEMPK